MTYIIQYIRAVVIKHANRMALILQDAPFASLADYKVFNLKWMKTQDEGSRFSSRRRLGSETLMRSIYLRGRSKDLWTKHINLQLREKR